MNQKKFMIGMIIASVFLIAGCTADNYTLDINKPVACTLDAKVCPDGSAVGREAPDCEFAKCPQESNVSQTEEFRKYVSTSITTCAATMFTCTNGSQQFFDERGCGCEPAEPRKIVESAPERCHLIEFACEANYVPFSDEAGCGCKFSWDTADAGEIIKVPEDGKLQAYDCPTGDREQACTREYVPVCGWNNPAKIQCIKYPCAATYGNKCEACANKDVISWTQGECPAAGGPGSAPYFPEKFNIKFRKYISPNITVCAASTFKCIEGSQQFFDQSGCGCEAIEPRKFVSNDAEQCQTLKYMCLRNYIPFSNENGCGCEWSWEAVELDQEPEPPIYNQGKLQAYDCPTGDREQACTREYAPVCGWNNPAKIQCIKYPCAATYGNKCEACANKDVISWTQGECPTDYPSETVESKTYCKPEQRESDICTMEYRPVCSNDGKTYSNPCTACNSETTEYWSEGECNKNQPTIRTYCNTKQKESDICTMEYRPVCSNDGKTYSNPCTACNSETTEYWTEGECN